MKNHKASENMTTKLVTISWNDSMQKASDLMEKNRIRHLPVRDSQGKIMGILSDRDVARATNALRPGFVPSSVVGDFMSWPVVTVEMSTPVRQLAEGMIDEKISAFLVTKGGKESEVVGIVTTEDLLRLLAKILTEESRKTKISAFPYNPIVQELLRDVETVGI